MESLKVPPIEQSTIECDLRKFTLWLNDLTDAVNYLLSVYGELKDTVESNKNRINALENRMTAAETKIENIYDLIENLDARVRELEGSGQGSAIDMLNGRIDLLYSWLPIPYGLIDGKGWKFAMGNANMFTGTNNPTDASGSGIFTHEGVNNNDVNFN